MNINYKLIIGVYTYNDGRKYEGIWAGGKMNGNGVFIYPDGRKYSGPFINDNRDGHGVFEWYLIIFINIYNKYI